MVLYFLNELVLDRNNSYEEEVRQFILHELHSGATFYETMGAYNMQKYREIITIVDKNEYQKLMNYVSKKIRRHS